MMKKLFLISLLLGMVFRANADHWVPNENLYPNTMSVIAVIKINGEEQLRTDLELGAFCGDEVRGSQRPTDEYYEVLPHYFLFLTTYGNDGDALTFRLYDHALDQELVATCLSDTIFTTNETLGNPGSPFVIEFVVETPSTYTITAVASPSEGGSVSGTGTFNNGATCTLTATPANGYDFVNWTEDNVEVSTNATYSFTVAGDRDLVANFEESEIPGSGSGTEDDPYDVTAAIALQDVPTSHVWVQGYIVGLVTSANNVNWTGPFNSNSNVAIANSPDCTNTDQCLYVQLPNNTALRTQVNLQDHPENLGRLLSVRGTLTPYFTPHAGLKNSPGTVNDFHLEAPETYTITVTANPAAGGIVTGAGEYVEGDSCTLVATPNDGYQFDNWTKGGAVVSNTATYAFAVTESGDYVANFSEIPGGEYHWSVNINQYPNTMSAIAIIKIDGVEQMDTNLEVAAFCGDECRGRELPTDEYYIPEVMPHYLVFLTTYGNDNDQFTFRLYDHNLNQEVVATCVTTATFVTNGTLGDPGDPFAIEFITSSTHTITVSADPEEGGTVSGGGEYDHGAECTLTAVANTGYTFINWTLNDQVVSTDAEYTFEVTGDAAYVAHFTLLQTYTITALANPVAGGTITGAGNYLEGTECTLTAVANTGYTFNNWTLNEVVIDTLATLTFTVTEAATYVANFTIENYNITVTANPAEGGTVTGSGTYDYGTECTLTATSATGYHFVNWTLSGEEVGTDTSFTFTVTEDAEYVAQFAINTYPITATAEPAVGGSVSGAGTYEHFSNCTLTATPAIGYHFVNWTMNDEEVGTDTILNFVVEGPVAYVAHFAINSYEISAVANPTAGGVVTGAGTYDHFSTCTLTAEANEGYTFINWTLNNEVVGNNSTISFTVAGTAEYVANFELNSYEITASVEPANTGTVSGAGTYDHFSTCTLTATAATGYHFVNWTLGGEEVGTEPELVFEVSGPASYVAHFAINNYAITVAAHPTNGGTVTGGGNFDHGTTVTLTAVSADQFIFVNWTKDNEEVSVDSIYVFTATEEGLYVANFERVMVTQHTEIHDGWNWYSTYIEQDELNQQEFNGLNMLEESLGTIGKKIVSQTTSTTYYANFGWMGRLHEITNEDSYRIQATATVETSITGPVVHPEEHPITLKQGWNWIGYPCTESMSLATALSGLTPSNRDQVKTVDKSAMYYANFGWMGRLQTIEPGMGLLYQSNNEADVVFTYPNASGNASKAEESIDFHWVANHYAYPDNMTIMAIVELDDEELISEQYEVAAFANGECRGSAPLMYVEPLDRYVAFLVLSGDEVTTLNFGLYNAASDTECFDSDTYVIYSSNAILGDPMEPFVIQFRNHTGINEFANRLTVFPNPVERGGVISLGANYDESEVRVEIINALGSVVYSKTASRMPESIAAPQVSGVYTLRITAKGEDACYRKLIVR